MKVYVVLETEAHHGGRVLGVATTVDGAKALVQLSPGREWEAGTGCVCFAWVTTPSWDAYEIEEWEVQG